MRRRHPVVIVGWFALTALLFPAGAHAFTLGRTCAGDGVGPGGLPQSVTGTATPTENGTYSVTVKDCCCAQVDECNPAPTNPSSKCQRGGRGTLSVAGIGDDAGCPFFTCNLSDQTEVIQDQYDGSCHPEVGFWFSRPTEVPNGVDDDCDGFIDDEQCDNVDNDGDGLLNEDPGSCLLQVAAVPVGWQRPLSEFRSFATAVFNNFLAQVGVTSCSDNFHLDVLDGVNLAAPTCSSSSDCGIASVRNAFRAQYGLKKEADYEVVAAFVDNDVCGTTAGCSDNAKFVWIEAKGDLLDEQKNEVFSHEVGHFLHLADEYCSQPAGSADARCSPKVGAPNPLTADLGCNPNDGGGCCNIDKFPKKCADSGTNGYGVCCLGNLAFDHSAAGGRSIMAYANATRPRGYDKSSLDYIRSPSNPRSATNPNGQAPLTCDFAYTGAKPVVYADVDVTPSGTMTLNSAVMTFGRTALGGPGLSGDMSIRLSTSQGMLLEDFFIPEFTGTDPQTLGVDYSGITWAKVNHMVIAALPQGLPATEPLKLTLTKDGRVTSEICLTQTAGGTLVQDTTCDDGNPCTVDRCDAEAGCSHTAAAADVVCRPATGECDAAEHCDGVTTECPADAHGPDDSPCDDDGQTCTADVCRDGICSHPAATCADDGNPCTVETCAEPGGCTSAPGNAGAECRAAAHDCDTAEQCDGVNAVCPADLPAADGAACTDDMDVCTSDVCAQGVCAHPPAPPAITFASIDCRLAALAAQVSTGNVGRVGTTLSRLLARAIERNETAAQATDSKRARNALRDANRRMVVFSHRVRSLVGRHHIAIELAGDLIEQADAIAADMLALRATL